MGDTSNKAAFLEECPDNIQGPPIPITFQASNMLSIPSCWSEAFTFLSCCDTQTFDFYHLPAILRREHELHGNPECWTDDVTYEKCCTLNANLGVIPSYRHGVFLFKVTLRRWPSSE